jgi:hypothetical protein
MDLLPLLGWAVIAGIAALGLRTAVLALSAGLEARDARIALQQRVAALREEQLARLRKKARERDVQVID